MPSRYSSDGLGAPTPRRWRARLGIGLRRRARSSRPTGAFADLLGPVLGGAPGGLADENLQSRLRGRPPDGGVQRHRGHRAHHRQQERDGHRLLHPLRRLGRRVRRDQGRPEDPRLRALPLPQPPGRGGRAARPDPRSGAREAAVGRAAARPARRPVPPALRACSTRCSRPTSSRTARRPSWWPTGSTRRWSSGWCAWSTGPSTSAARCPRACASPPRRSARTAGCRSPTTTAGPAAARR